jgi:hypothetical protein
MKFWWECEFSMAVVLSVWSFVEQLMYLWSSLKPLLFWWPAVRKCDLWDLNKTQWESLGVYTMRPNYLRMRIVRDGFSSVDMYYIYCRYNDSNSRTNCFYGSIEGNVKLWAYYKFICNLYTRVVVELQTSCIWRMGYNIQFRPSVVFSQFNVTTEPFSHSKNVDGTPNEIRIHEGKEMDHKQGGQ